MLTITLTKSVYNFFDDTETSIAELNRIEKKMDEAKDVIKFQEFLLKKYPQLNDYIAEGTYSFKRDALVKQVEAYIQELKQGEQNEDTTYKLKSAEDLVKSIDTENEEEFEKSYQIYKQVRK
ncbi:MAG: hypothetical protein ABI721_00235 [Candidatus Dojkabacteria bacterium]